MQENHAQHASDQGFGSLYSHKGIEVMDSVRFKDDVVGNSPLTGEVIEVKEGTEGTVTKISDNGHFTVEVPNLDSMIPLCFVQVDIDLISLLEH